MIGCSSITNEMEERTCVCNECGCYIKYKSKNAPGNVRCTRCGNIIRLRKSIFITQ